MSDHQIHQGSWKNILASSEPPESGRAVADLFTVLSDPEVLPVLEFALDHNHSVADCSTHFGVAEAWVAGILDFLAERDCVSIGAAGEQYVYGARGGLLAELMNLARAMARDRSGALASCVCIKDAHGLDPPRAAAHRERRR